MKPRFVLGALSVVLSLPAVARGETELLSLAICFDKEVVLIAEDSGYPRLEKVDAQRLERIAKHSATREWFGLSSGGSSEPAKKFPRAAVRSGSRSGAGRTVQDAVVLGSCSDPNELFATQKITRPRPIPASADAASVAAAVADEVCPGDTASSCPRAELSASDLLSKLEIQKVGEDLALHVATFGLSAATKDTTTRFLALLSVSEGRAPKFLSTIGNFHGPDSKEWHESVRFSSLVEVSGRKVIIARVDSTQEGGGASAVQIFQVSTDGSVVETNVELASYSRKEAP